MLRPATRERDARGLDGVAERRDEPQVGDEALEAAEARNAADEKSARHARPDQREETERPPAPCERPERRTDREDGRVAGGGREACRRRAAREGRRAPALVRHERQPRRDEPQEDGRDVGGQAMALEHVQRCQGESRRREERPALPHQASGEHVQHDDRQRREADVEHAADDGQSLQLRPSTRARASG
jgi:hypothetical protein